MVEWLKRPSIEMTLLEPFSLFKRGSQKSSLWVFFPRIMGRTVPTWRGRVEQEIEVLVPYRRALSTEDRCRFDTMLHDVRMRRAAGGMLPTHESWKPMLLSMVLGAHERIQLLEQQLALLQQQIQSLGGEDAE